MICGCVGCRRAWPVHAWVVQCTLWGRQCGPDAECCLRADAARSLYPRRLQRRLLDRCRRLLRRSLHRPAVLPRRRAQPHRHSSVPARLHLVPGSIVPVHSRYGARCYSVAGKDNGTLTSSVRHTYGVATTARRRRTRKWQWESLFFPADRAGLPWVWGFPWGFPWVWVWYGYGDYDESPWVLWVICGDFWMDVTFAE